MIQIKRHREVVEGILQLVYPRRCPVCDGIVKGKDKIHPLCYKKLYPVTGAVCFRCGAPVKETKEYCYDCETKNRQRKITMTAGRALFVYKGEMKNTMYRFKYQNKREYALFFAEYAHQVLADWIIKTGAEVILPVPMYYKKERIRGYNQAKVFARELSRRIGIAYDKGLLKRVKDTTPLKELNPQERKNNLQKAFHIEKNIVKYKKVIVIDDIYTTGNTADEIAKVLYQKGVGEVYFLVICIGMGY